mmetsp:Transcript_5231/g.8768  ORF Transcript_5231/g.8768 Transcript_5231/m.8768 type:complete len:340 (+) Transcript_5231:57-1076(+)
MAEQKSEYQVGDKVVIKPDKKGQILCVIDGGKAKAKEFALGTWYGVRLTEKRGTTDGRYKGQDPFFFKCPMNFGVFVQGKLIIKKIDDDSFDFMEEQKQMEEKERKDAAKYEKARAKVAQLKAAFKKMDDDGSKSLEEKEFIPMATEQLGCDKDDAVKLFNEIDASGNGSVSFAEFDSWLKGGGGIDKLLQYRDLKNAFKNADKDGNLSLDADEFVKLAKEAMNLKQAEAASLFKKIDANENGSVCFDEFEAYVDGLGGMDNFKVYSEIIDAFKAADNDKSGALEIAEFSKLVKEKLGLNKFKAAKIFRSIDKDKSETVSLEEFEKWVEKIGGVKKIQK